MGRGYETARTDDDREPVYVSLVASISTDGLERAVELSYVLPDLRIGELLDARLDCLAHRKDRGHFNYKASSDTDPFAAAIEMSEYRLDTVDEWWDTFEGQRLWQKAMTESLGHLQQDIVGRLEGWESNHPEGDDETKPDLVGSFGNQGIVAEIKNKWNTMNDGGQKSVYDKLASALERPEYHGFKAIVILLITPQLSQKLWRPFQPAGRDVHPNIMRMGGRVFYALATDPQNRGIAGSISPADRKIMAKWDTWDSVDQMANQFFAAVEERSSLRIGSEIRDMVASSMKS